MSKEILDKFEKDFNEAPTVNEGLEKAFANLPEDYLKLKENDKNN